MSKRAGGERRKTPDPNFDLRTPAASDENGCGAEPPSPGGTGAGTSPTREPPLALQEGVSPVLVAFRLGHTTTRMIETTCGRLIESMDADIAARLSSTAHPPRRSQSTGTVGNR